MKRLFISDLHLDESRPDLTQAFFRFVDEFAAKTDELYILGDFFEVWLGDDDKSDFALKVIQKLRCLPCKIFVMHGNRDFLIGSAFCRDANVVLLDDPSTIMFGNRKAVIMHGDSLCTLDVEYMKARALLRSEAFQTDFLDKPLAERAAFASQIRGESQSHTRQAASDIMDVTPSAVEHTFNHFGVDLLIHGHTHRPAHHTLMLYKSDSFLTAAGSLSAEGSQTAEGSLPAEGSQTADGSLPAEGSITADRIVLGDWHTSMQFLTANDDELSLQEFVF